MHPSGVAYSSTSFGWSKGGKVTSAGWQVTLSDPMWHVSSRSGVATLRTAIHLLLIYLLTLLLAMWQVHTTMRRTRTWPSLLQLTPAVRRRVSPWLRPSYRCPDEERGEEALTDRSVALDLNQFIAALIHTYESRTSSGSFTDFLLILPGRPAMHSIRCGLLLPCVCVCVYLSVGRNREPYKTAEPIEVPFGTKTREEILLGPSPEPGTTKQWN